MRTLKPLTAKYAPVVTTGSITSTDKNNQAQAINDRISLNFGDIVYRSWAGIHSLGRNLFRMDVTIGEREEKRPAPTHQYMFADNDAWVNLDVDPESADLYNRIVCTSIGNTDANFYGNIENIDTRLRTCYGDSYTAVASTINNPAELWYQLNLLRGTYDISTDTMQAPALENALKYIGQSYSPISTRGYLSPSYQPTPEYVDPGCFITLPLLGETWYPSYKLKFTNRTNPLDIIEYTGTCSEPGGYYYTADGVYYYIYQYDSVLSGSLVNQLKRSEYLYGPLTGGGTLERESDINLFESLDYMQLKAYRGNNSEWIQQDYTLGNAFDNQAFFDNPYTLAPQYKSGSTAEHYWQFTGGNLRYKGISASSSIQLNPGYCATTYYMNTGSCVFTTGSIIQFKSGSTVLFDLPINTECKTLPSTARGNLSLSLSGSIHSGTGFLIYHDEIMEYYPTHFDLKFVMRLGARTQTEGDDVFPDEMGLGTGKTISDNYFVYGQPLAIEDQSGIDQKVYSKELMAFRRLLANFIAIRGTDIVGYETSAGKSVIYINRTGTGNYYDPLLDLTTTADINGYSNEWVALDQIKPNVISFPLDESFDTIPSYNFPLFNRSLFLADMIDSDAGGRAYKTLGSHTSLFSDDYEFYRFGQSSFRVPEVPLGYHFAQVGSYSVNVEPQSNAIPWGLTNEEYMYYFCKSNQLYQPPYNLESSEITSSTIGATYYSDLLKITFDERFDHVDSGDILTYGEPAASSISLDWRTWDSGSIDNQPYRTIENAIQSYLISFYTAGDEVPYWPTYKVGDCSPRPSGPTTSDDIPPCFIPDFLCMKKVGKVYEDGNDDYDTMDTRVEVDPYVYMHFIINAACNGYYDGKLTGEILQESVENGTMGLLTGNSWDYNFDNLKIDALESTYMFAATGSGFRYGIGPLPNTDICKEAFNQYSKIINKMDKCRLMIPAVMEWRQDSITTPLAEDTSFEIPTGPICYVEEEQLDGYAYSVGDTVTPDIDWYAVYGATYIDLSSTVGVGVDGYGTYPAVSKQEIPTEYRLVLDSIFLFAIPYEFDPAVSVQLPYVRKDVEDVTYGIWEETRGTLASGSNMNCLTSLYEESQCDRGTDPIEYWNRDLIRSYSETEYTTGTKPIYGNIAFSGASKGDGYLLRELGDSYGYPCGAGYLRTVTDYIFLDAMALKLTLI